MRKSKSFLSIVGTVAFFSTAVWAVTIEYPLADPFEYNREIGPVLIEHQSPVDIYVANVYDPMRWKDWLIKIWVPENTPDLFEIWVDYDNTPDHSNPIEVFPVPVAPLLGPSPFEGYKGFYANTWEQLWWQYGTNPVGSTLPHSWGNPAWVSFHFNVDQGVIDPIGLFIKDACIPEPTTMALLGLGALVLTRKHNA